MCLKVGTVLVESTDLPGSTPEEDEHMQNLMDFSFSLLKVGLTEIVIWGKTVLLAYT